MMDIHPHDLTKLFSGLTEKGLLNQEGTGRGTIYFRPEARYDDTWEVLRSGGTVDGSGGLGVSSGGWEELQVIAAPISGKKRALKGDVDQVILQLCAAQPLTLDQLTKLLNRSMDGLRKDYLRRLIKVKKLRYRYPTIPNHPEQAYISDEASE